MSGGSRKKLSWVVGAGVVGADLGTTVFYGTGILFPIVGYLTPIFILVTCLIMWLFRFTYVEGMALSPYNGGAYSMILRTLGRRFAVLAGALTFVSYLTTASVSALSGGFYLESLFDSLGKESVVLLSFIPIVIFSILNTKGIEEPAKLVTGITVFHFFLLGIISLWGFVFVIFNWSEIDFSKMKNIVPDKDVSLGILFYGFAASFLGVTGFESAAQIVEELKAPILKTVKKLYKAVILAVSITAPLVSFLCLLILTPAEVEENIHSLISRVCQKMGGTFLLTVVVVDATLTLFAAVNTAFVGFIGLAKTMAKQGNLPKIMLYRVNHIFPWIRGYPFISFPFALVAMFISALVAEELKIGARVYGLAFLGVMVSFCLGVVLMRNFPLRRGLEKKYLAPGTFFLRKWSIPSIPFVSGLVLLFSLFVLLLNSEPEAKAMLVSLCFFTVLLMAYYRWGVLEDRLVHLNDLRLGIGKFSDMKKLPENVTRFVLCCGIKEAKKNVERTLNCILKSYKEPFELIIFHAQEDKDPHGFFFERLQRVVSQQIANQYYDDFILTVKILPGDFIEGLEILKKQYKFDSVIVGETSHPDEQKVVEKLINVELGINIYHLKDWEDKLR